MTTDRVLAYLGGELEPEAERALEERLFAGDLDGPDLTATAALVVAVREAAFLGILSVFASAEEAARLRALGYRVVEVSLRPGEVAVADLSGDFDLLFLSYEVDLAGVHRLDVEVCDLSGRVIKRTLEIPFAPGSDQVTGFCARELALAGVQAHPEGLVNRFLSVEAGGDRVLGEFRARALR